MITLKTLPQATAQEVFDQVVSHLRAQGKKSGVKSPVGFICLYRGPGGTKCAGGCLIGDDEYSAGMEGNSWGSLRLDRKVPEKHRLLIVELQSVHDVDEVEDWELKFKDVAREFNLIYQ